MARHVEAWMDGVALSSVGPFLLQQIQEEPPETEQTSYARPGMDGQWAGPTRRTALRIVLMVAIRELYDLPRRAMLAEALAVWANGKILQTSNRPGRRLRVRCTGAPALGAVRDYTQEMRVELTAWAPPYWEDEIAERLTLTGSTGSGTIRLPGTADAPVAVTVTVTPESALTDLSLTVGENTITLAERAVPADTPLTLDRDEEDNLRITAAGVSQLRKRTAASADDLYCPPGNVEISFTANAAVELDALARGRWR